MLFNSLTFLLFLPCVWLLYTAVGKRFQNLVLLLASYLFYGWWDWRFLSLLWISTVVDYTCGIAMARHPTRKRGFLIASLVTNLGILGMFKYCDFFLHSAEHVLGILGFEANLPVLGFILPVGISFYTFQTMAYSIDVYRGNQLPTSNLLSFALYVAYFPQLVAGPIERSTHLLPEIERRGRANREDASAALELCLQGYFKKVFIADSIAPLVNNAFNDWASQSALSLLVAGALFALQIYGDFAGYSDIARGVSRLFGIRLCVNFRQPYLSANITDFWRRWHISLSTWLRDYLYIPLGGSRKGVLRTYGNLMATMLLGGLWHGASWNFVVWGGLHGLYLSVHKLMMKRRGAHPNRPIFQTGFWHSAGWLFRVLATFVLVCLTWIFFRSSTLTQSVGIVTRILTFAQGAFPLQSIIYLLFYGGTVILLDALCWFRDEETPFGVLDRYPLLKGAVYGIVLVLILCLGETDAQPFIYFQF
ncbi:MAG: MBOAT family protein [Verrucomicrobiae bacterium]|nr:MBOAT family protein [Verrucomicrobiae bacterium]